MSNQRLEALRSSYRAKVNGVAGQLAQKERQILARTDVTASQKRGMVNSVRGQASQRLADLTGAYQADQQRIVEKLRRDLYRLPPKAAGDLSWRDAWAKARAIADDHDPKDNQRALRQAQREFAVAATVGDESMLRALLMAAELRGWTGIHQAYAREVPEAGETMAEIEGIRAELADQQTTYADRAMFTMPEPQPPPPPPSLAVALDNQASQWNGGSGEPAPAS
jgi:hypothetical protein